MKLAAIAWSSCLLFAASRARADPTPAERTIATQLFDDADKLAAAKNYREACPKYAESQRLDPQLGTLLHLADCQEKTGKTATAWMHFKDAIDIAVRRGDARVATAKVRAAALEPKLARVQIDVPAEAPADLEVRQDGDVMGRPAWGTAVPIDPGTHVITAKATGFKPWKTSIQVSGDGGRVNVAVPLLEAEPRASAPAPVVPPPGVPVAQGDAPSSGSSQRVVGYVLGGAGIVALGVGGAFFWKRNSKVQERDAVACPMDLCMPDDKAHIDQLTEDARTAATTGLIFAVAGGAAVIGGGILVLTAPSRPAAVSVHPTIGLHAAGATLAIRW